DSAVFPGQQGGPLEHVIAAKAVSLLIASSDEFAERQRRTVAGAQAIAEILRRAGIGLLTGGTDVHLVLTDLRDTGLTGKEAEERLESIGIIVNRNAIPFDPLPPMVASGVRIGTSALASRGFTEEEFAELGEIIAVAFGTGFEAARAELADRVAAM